MAVIVAVMSWRETLALGDRVEALQAQVVALSMREPARQDGVATSRTIVEERLISGRAAEPLAAPATREPSAAERFEEDDARDPGRRAELVRLLRDAAVEVDSVECNRTTCALSAAPPADEVARFVETATNAIGPGVRMEMVYEEPVAGRQRVVIYAR